MPQTMPILNLSAENDIYYELIDGDPAKPWLVFLHEGLGCCAMWKDFPLQLCQATGCRGLLYDRLGYGLSSPLAARRRIHYLHDAALRELPHVLAALIQRVDFLAVMAVVRQHLDQAPGGNVLVDVKVRQARNAGTGNSHAPDRLAVVGLQVALDDAIHNAAALIHRPYRRRTAEVEAQAVMLAEGFEGFRHTVFLQVQR